MLFNIPVIAVRVSISCKNCYRLAMSSTVIVALELLLLAIAVLGTGGK